MGYSDMGALGKDDDFQARVAACVCEQAQTPGHDDIVAQRALQSPAFAVSMFMPFVSTAPGFGDAYASGGQAAVTDGMLLSAVQAKWGDVVNVWAAPAPTPEAAA